MLAFFRRALSSKIVLGLFALIIIAFMLTGVETGNIFSAASTTSVATVGRSDIDAETVRARAEGEVRQQQRQQPGLTLAAYTATGGLTPLIDQAIDGEAIVQWAEKQGFTASKRLVDGEIASIPAFAGPTGQFDRGAMMGILAQQRVTEAQLRADMRSDILRRLMLVPIASGLTVGPGLARPYAGVMLEARQGLIGVVPAASMPEGPAPTDAEIAAEYRKNLARYTLPERRVLRYAQFGPESVTAGAVPDGAAVAAAYKAAAATYAASEERTLQQVIVPTQAAAATLVKQVRAGTAFADAASAAGFAAGDIAVAARTRDSFAKLSSPAIAAAAFALPAKGVIDPVKSSLGWHVVNVAAIVRVAGKTLDQARPDLVKALTARKATELLADKVNRLEDAIANGATFDEAAAKEKLTVATTPALLAGGTAPDQPGYTLPPALAPLLKPAFAAASGDKPTVESLGAAAAGAPDRGYALLGLGQVVPSAPRPLAQVRDAVVHDIRAVRASAKAQAVAKQILARTQGGTPLAAAFAAAGLGLTAPKPVTVRQIDLEQSQQRLPPLELLFTLAKGKAATLPLPSDQGYYIVQLTNIAGPDRAMLPRLADTMRQQMAQSISNEIVQQFANAAKQAVGVKRHEQAIAKLRNDILAQGAAAQ